MPKLIAHGLSQDEFNQHLSAKSPTTATPRLTHALGSDRTNMDAMFRCLPGFDHPNPEVRAYYLVGFGRACLFISFNFLVAAVIHFAYLDSGCRQYGLDDDSAAYDDGEKNAFYAEGWAKAEGGKPGDCEGKVYGLRPSSIVSVLATVGGLVSAFGMPIAGAIVSHHRPRIH